MKNPRKNPAQLSVAKGIVECSNHFDDSSEISFSQGVELGMPNLSDWDNKELEKHRKDVSIQLSRAGDIAVFALYCFKDTAINQPIILAPFHLEWHNHFDMYDDAAVLAPRGHGKTVNLIIRTLMQIGRNPQIRIKLISCDDQNASGRLQSCKVHIDSNIRVHEVFPNMVRGEVGTWTKSEFTVKRSGADVDPTMSAYGVLSSGTGGRANIMKYDDICDQRNAIDSPELRPKVYDNYNNVWSNLLIPGGREEYIATIWHYDDTTARLRNKKIKHFLVHRVGSNVGLANEDIFYPLWDVFPRVALEKRFKKIGKKAYRRNFLHEVSPDEELQLNSIRNCIHPDKAALDPEVINPAWPIYMGVDIATSLKLAADYSCIFTIAVAPDLKRYVKSVWRRRASPRALVRALIDQYRLHNPQIIHVETNNTQAWLMEWVGAEASTTDMSLPLEGFFTSGKNKSDPDEGIPSLSVEFENKLWIVPTKGIDLEEPDENGLAAWIKECEQYPFGAHDDTVMAAWLAQQAAIKYEGSFEASNIPVSKDTERDAVIRTEVDDILGTGEDGDRPMGGFSYDIAEILDA